LTTRHPSIVIITSIVVAATASAVSSRFGAFSRVGGLIGSSVSAAFLLILGAANAYILCLLVREMRRLLSSSAATRREFRIEGGGLLFRLFKRMFRLIDA